MSMATGAGSWPGSVRGLRGLRLPTLMAAGLAGGMVDMADAAKKQARERYQEVIEKYKDTDAATVAKTRLK